MFTAATHARSANSLATKEGAAEASDYFQSIRVSHLNPRCDAFRQFRLLIGNSNHLGFGCVAHFHPCHFERYWVEVTSPNFSSLAGSTFANRFIHLSNRPGGETGIFPACRPANRRQWISFDIFY